MTIYEQIIQHEGSLYLVEYLDNGLITAVYAENGRKINAERHPDFKPALEAYKCRLHAS